MNEEVSKMKNVAKFVGIVSVLALLASPAFAGGEGAAADKPLSITQFAVLPDNNGAHFKMIQRRYEEYRSGRWVPKSTLTVEKLR